MSSNEKPKVILTGFADEAALDKTVDQQFSAFAALGLQYYTIRFIDCGNGVKNVMQLTDDEVNLIKQKQDDYGLKVSSLGSPIGKVKLQDVNDGTKNTFVDFDTYLKEDVQRACELANRFETKLVRGFSFYHPKGTNPEEHLPLVSERLTRIAEVCDSNGLTFGLEVEANLVGQSGPLLAKLHESVNHPALVTIFDAANIVTQGCSSIDVLDQYREMKPGLGWLHIKDYRHPSPVQKTDHVDEEALKHFVPPDQGDSGHEAILRDLRDYLPEMESRMNARGVPGIFLDLEPHVRGGGQFGGFSGPDGLGVTLRALCRLLDYVGIDYHLRDFHDVLAGRGF